MQVRVAVVEGKEEPGVHATYAVVMAGGVGERLQPISSAEKPKQFLALLSAKTMLQETVDRILPITPLEQVYVSTGTAYVGLVREQLPDLPNQNVLAEPIGRGTAACIGLAAITIGQRDPNAVMVVLPADHQIRDVARFRTVLLNAIEAARAGDRLITLGIDPNHPSTEYGYLKAGEQIPMSGSQLPIRRLEQFVEKPTKERAEQLLSEGGYYWNSGMFVWRATAILHEIEKYMPELHSGLSRIAKALRSQADASQVILEVFQNLKPASIDRGVMEKSTKGLVIPTGDMGWSDVGSFESLRKEKTIQEKPWGYEELWGLTASYAGKILHIRKGQSLSLQYHNTKDETIRVLSGQLRLLHGDSADSLTPQELCPGERFRIPPGLLHRMEAIEECDVLEVSTPHLLDVVRLADHYGRVGT